MSRVARITAGKGNEMERDNLDAIVMKQLGLQDRLGYDFTEMTIDQAIDYVKLNVLALTDELHEALAECHGWKPWTKGEHAIDRDKYLGELTDALHFLVNLYLVVGGRADEITALFMKKNAVNHTRQDTGYTGQKCAVCRRELDGLPVLARGEKRYCSQEHMDLDALRDDVATEAFLEKSRPRVLEDPKS